MTHCAPNRPLNTTETATLGETSSILVAELLLLEPGLYAEPKGHELVEAAIGSLLSLQLETCSVPEDAIERSIREAIWNHNLVVAPRRSYTTSFIRVSPNVNKIASRLAALRAIPQPPQRTEAWYAFRREFITASGAWQAFGSTAQRNQLIFEKCRSADDSAGRQRGVSVTSPLHWGQKYEPVSAMLYEKWYETDIVDLGCIPHPDIGCLAASPDGINGRPGSSRYGRMLEIKNVVNRLINGIPKREYWIQMQLQMAVCGLHECDFLETKFVEYDSEELFWSDGTDTHTSGGAPKGLMMQYLVDGAPEYEYAPIGLCRQELELWRTNVVGTRQAQTWVACVFWRLQEYSCILVLENKEWFRWAASVLESTWKTILAERQTGCAHRAPCRRPRRTLAGPPACSGQLLPAGKCFLDGTLRLASPSGSFCIETEPLEGATVD
jgi:hypothetical protein